MNDLGIQLHFDSPENSVAFSRALADAKECDSFRVLLLEPKLNVDAATILLVVKFAGPAASAATAFLVLGKTILKMLKKPSVRIEIEGKSVELRASASDEDIKVLCDVLLRSKK